eukprot:GHVS01007747.1.p1 GENE.GHVS01007747.1~~GHVS01007747.1.p1  ORF type:complete len:174 (-),score=43.92 GHVS01007747.1:351-872(-)
MSVDDSSAIMSSSLRPPSPPSIFSKVVVLPPASHTTSDPRSRAIAPTASTPSSAGDVTDKSRQRQLHIRRRQTAELGTRDASEAVEAAVLLLPVDRCFWTMWNCFSTRRYFTTTTTNSNWLLCGEDGCWVVVHGCEGIRERPLCFYMQRKGRRRSGREERGGRTRRTKIAATT